MKSSYLSQQFLNYKARMLSMASLTGGIWLGLFTTIPTESGGGTEVTGGSYARVQIAGQVTAGASWASSATAITLGATVPAWVVTGMTVYSVTKGAAIATVAAGSSGTTLSITAAATSSSGSADVLAITAFAASSGAGPSTIASGCQVTFPSPTANWGTVQAFGTFDAASSGNNLDFDWLGNYQWLPTTVSAASPGVLNQHAHGYSNGDLVVWSANFGGTTPSFSQSNFTGILTVANQTTDTFTVTNAATAVNTSGTGNGMVRKINTLQITNGMAAPFFTSGQLFESEE